MHIVFTDGTVADIFASELVLGGVSNWLEVMANNHRTRCQLNPIDALTTFNPTPDAFRDVYLTEKIETKLGWSHPAPDEAWQHGYPQEFQDFIESITAGRAAAGQRRTRARHHRHHLRRVRLRRTLRRRSRRPLIPDPRFLFPALFTAAAPAPASRRPAAPARRSSSSAS